MRRAGILNDRVCGTLAALGHGDILMVVDAGFPIPTNAQRIDLSLTEGIPDLRLVLSLIHDELIVERVVLAAEVGEFNAPLQNWITREFSDAELDARPHSEMLTAVPARAKAIIRTGAFEPWGNIGLVSGVDVPRWFSRQDVVVPDYYRERMSKAAAALTSEQQP